MKCPECQTKNPETRKFCRECGAKLILFCPQCTSENLPGDKFCGECGHDLKKSAEPSPIDYNQPQSYTPKHLADKILTTRSAIQGERKLVTVLFADVANYTSISERLDPEDVHDIMDGCFRILMDEIHRYEGTINQFRGDGVMAIFGAPVAHEDHTQRACYAALGVQKALKGYSKELEEKFGIKFQMRIGLNSGHVVVGSIGDDLRMDYTAEGDTTNLASRMEGMARPGNILVTKNTYKMVKAFFEFDALGEIKVKGKEEAQHAYELIKASEVETRIEAAAAKGLTKFVGRGREMEALTEAFEKGRSGSGQVLGIVGEAGVGKSRLLLEIRNMLPQEEFLYLEGRCLHYGGSMAYLPILDILRSCFGIKEGDQAILIKKKMDEKVVQLDDRLQGAIPPFQELLSLKVEDEAFLKLEPQQKRERIFEATRNLLIRESQNKPLVIAIEDLQWIDKTSEEFLDYLIGWLANTHILLILLYRPEYSHQWGSKSYYSKIGVGQLSTRTSSELVQSILEGAEVVPELTDLILNKTTGNPLFMEELIHTLLENGSIERKDNQYVLSRKASDIKVPDTVQGIISARMDRLEEGLKRIMQVASVIGREFASRILQTITGMKDELKSHLLNLQRLEFIYEKTLFPEIEYVFKHALTQEVAYNSLLLKRRKEIHRRIGKAIEELYAENLAEFYEVLAYHYERAEIPDKAIRYLTKAGDRARSIYANEQAIVFYQAAIDQVSKFLRGKANSPEDLCKTATRLHESLGDALEWTGQHDKARDALKSALTQAPKHDLIWQARLHRKTGNIFRLQHRQGDSIRAYNLAESKLGVEPIGSDPEWRQEWIQIQLERMSLYYWMNQWHKISELADKLQPIVEQYGQPTQRVNFFLSLANMNNRRDRYVVSEQTLALCRAALAIGQEADNPSDIAWAQFLLGFGHLWRGDLDQAEEQMQAALALAERTGDMVHQARCLTYLAILYRKRSQVEEARHYVSRSLAAATTAQTLEIVATARANLAWLAWREENLSEAEVKGRAALDLWQQLPVGHAIYPFQWTALWPMIGVALAQELNAEAVDYARAMLNPSQQSLPDALNMVLEKVIKTFEGGELEEIGIHLNHAIELAQELGYL